MMLCYTSCKPEVKIESYLNEASPLVDEYEGMVIPYNIAPLNFFVSVDDGVINNAKMQTIDEIIDEFYESMGKLGFDKKQILQILKDKE